MHTIMTFQLAVDYLEQNNLMGPWDPGPGTRMKGPTCFDPSTGTQTLRFGMFGSQVLGPTVPGPE